MAINDPFIGQQIGNYRILKLINSGSFGSVYQGQHLIFEDEPIVAIKVLHANLASPEERTAFVKEAQLLKKLQHPHILRIIDAGFHNGLPYLVTELASSGSLRDRLRKQNNQPLPVDEAVRILTQIGDALSYAHRQNIVHRDLKPENILFNGNGEALLADFGIAVILASARTGLMGRGGTPSYMAPEQFEGLVSPKSDQYALGCIAYELVTGHRLFSLANPTLEAFWYHHAKVEPVSPRNYNSAIPTNIEQAILTALAKDRTKRYQGIATFVQALSKTEQRRPGANQAAPAVIPSTQRSAQASRATGNKKFDAMIRSYNEVRNGNINDPETIKRIASAFEAIENDPVERRIFPFDAARAALNLRRRAQYLEELEEYERNTEDTSDE